MSHPCRAYFLQTCTGIGSADVIIARLTVAVRQNHAMLDRILAEQQQQVGDCIQVASYKMLLNARVACQLLWLPCP